MFSAMCCFLRSVVEQCCVGEETILLVFLSVASHILAAGKAQQVSLNNPVYW